MVARAPGELLASDGNFGEQQLRLSDGVTSALRSLAQRHGLTLHTMVKGAWALLLSRYSGEPDVVFGDARGRARSQVDGGDSMVGMFLNPVPLRVHVDPECSLLEWLVAPREGARALGAVATEPVQLVTRERQQVVVAGARSHPGELL